MIDKYGKMVYTCIMELSDLVKSQSGLVTDLRRDLHKIPELSFCEFDTSKYITDFLDKLNVSYKKIGTGVYVDFIGEDKTKTIGLRSDMDALPIIEKVEVDFKSTNGNMHACGHDGHMAMLLVVCKLLSKTKPKFNVRVIFQFAEEGDGGAEKMIEKGVLKGVDEIYALHLSPELNKGEIATNYGALFAGAVEFDVITLGVSSHCAEPEKGKNALKAMVDFLYGFDEYIKPYQKNTLLHYGAVSAGRARNIVCDNATSLCTLRYFDINQQESIMMNIANSLVRLDKKYGTSHTVNVKSVYPPLLNSAVAVDNVKKVVDELIMCDAKYTAEDFAFYSQIIPACMCWLGIKDKDYSSPLHSELFGFNEDALLYGIEFYKRLIY